jgi:CheY-like chemotaxis protein
MSSAAVQKSGSLFTRADGSPRRVLYAEDQTSSRIVTTAMLKRMGFEVDAVEDGELALQQARTENYDVILLDIEMPVMDGVTAARSIRKDLKHCDGTPIYALSAFLADSTEATVWRDAFDSALPKPANSNELLQAMTKAMGQKDKNLAVQAANDQPVVATATNMLSALRKTLTAGSWQRLQITAANEMRQLGLVMGAALEAGDDAIAAKCKESIIGMAHSFEAETVADKIHEHMNPVRVTFLLQAIDAWQIG